MRNRQKIKKNIITKKKGGSGLLPRFKYFALRVMPPLVLILVIYFVSAAVISASQIRQIDFSGSEHLTDEELRALSGLKGNENLVTLSGNRVFRKMTSSPWIRSVSIRKEFPDTLQILVKESVPFALLELKGKLYIVDDRGEMLQELKDSPIPFLPVISGAPFGRKENISEALSLVRAIKEKGLMFEKEHIEVIAAKPREMAVNFDGVIVKVGEGDYEDKLLRFMDLEEEISNRNIHVDYIDLRFADRAIVKPVHEVIK